MTLERSILVESPGETGAEVAFDGMSSDVAVQETSALQHGTWSGEDSHIHYDVLFVGEYITTKAKNSLGPLRESPWSSHGQSHDQRGCTSFYVIEKRNQNLAGTC